MDGPRIAAAVAKEDLVEQGKLGKIIQPTRKLFFS